MATAKRLYLYIVSSVGLGMGIVASILMVELLLDRLGFKPESASSPYALAISLSDKETLSVAIAMIVIGLALWIIHWGLIERIVRGADDEAIAERSSIVRSVYFSLVMATLLLVAAAMAAQTLSDVLGNLFDGKGRGASLNYSFNLSIMIVLLAVWGYHAWIRNRDLKQGRAIAGAAAWFSRLYLYGIVLAGVLIAIASASSLITTIGNQLASKSSSNYWLRPELTQVVWIAVGAALWASHWVYSNRICKGETEQGESERISRVRFAFMMLVVVAGASALLGGLSSGLNYLFVWVFNLVHGGVEPVWRFVLIPVIASLPAAGAWLWHRRRAIAESAATPAEFSSLRIADYITAGVGLYAIAVGSFTAASTILNQWFNPLPSLSISGSSYSMGGDMWKLTLASAVAMIVAGVAIWVLPWIAAQRRRNSDHVAETTSSSRSYYLYAVAVASIIACAIGAAILVYLYVRLAVGLPDPTLGSKVSTPIALALVAGALLAYHLMTLRSDPNPPVARVVPPLPTAPIAPPAPAPMVAPPPPFAPPAPVAPPAPPHETAG